MNRKQYNSDPRYAKVLEQMDLLGIMDVTTTRQDYNGTIVWKLPIKNQWKDAKLIEVASFHSGYVRNNNSASTNYQLNKRCESEPSYYEIKNNGEILYRKYTTRTCKLIPIEIDRLEYLISYCLKNYYIKHANYVANGNYIAKWEHKWELEKLQTKYDNLAEAARLDYDCGHYNKLRDLENKLDTIKRISDYE